jgi:thymidylate kinase
MGARQLVFVEGIPGIGKSTTAEKLSGYLEENGCPTRWYHEMADNNPIRTRGMDAMRLTHPTRRPY